MRVTGHDSCWVSPFGHPRITARLPTPQGLSQAPTSFIGSRCQGIHHVPFIACHHKHHNTTTDPKRPAGRATTPAHDTPQKKLAPQPPPPPPTPYGASRTSVSVVVRRYKIHPPHTSSNYSRHGSADDARVHYPDLKQQPHTTPTPPTRPGLAGTKPRPPPPRPDTQDRSQQTQVQQTQVQAPTPGMGGADASEPQQCVPTPSPPGTTLRAGGHQHPSSPIRGGRRRNFH